MSLPFEPHFLVFAAEGTDEALRIVTAIHYRATRHARDHYRRVRSCVSAGIAPLLVHEHVGTEPWYSLTMVAPWTATANLFLLVLGTPA